MKRAAGVLLAAVLVGFPARFAGGPAGGTEILRWQDGKRGAVSLTFDDNSPNQFRVAVPILRSLQLPATFHIITGEISGSRFQAAFIGRPVKTIVEETAAVPTGKDNFFERASAIGHLGLQGTIDIHTRAGELFEEGKVAEAYRLIDEAYAKVRRGGFPPEPKAEDGAGSGLTWADLKKLAGEGFEFSSHTVTHARLAVLDERNLAYELERSREDILHHLGPKHTFTVECPYGTEDERVVARALAVYPASRNRMPEPFLVEINRGSDEDPAGSTEDYVQWQRGVLTKTSMALMKSWVDTTAAQPNIWLVLVFHGVDGVGWEPRTGADLKEYFSYIAAREGSLWVATFQDVTKYMREREHATVRERRTDGLIELSLEHGLKRDLYDLPLTLKTTVPETWSIVEVRQGSRVERVQAVKDGGGRQVVYRASPNAGRIRLGKAAR